MKEHPEDWDLHIPTILLGYRASIQASTRFSPFFVLHGYEMPLPIRALNSIATPASGLEEPAAQSILENMTALHEVRTAALSNIAKAQDKQCRTYAARTRHAAKPDVVSPGMVAPGLDKGKSIALPATLHVAPAQPTPAMPTPAMQPVTRSVATPAASTSSEPPLVLTQSAVNPMTAAVAHATVSAQPYLPAVQVDDFVLVRKYEKVRTSGNKRGKLADKVEGPFILTAFTDASMLMAVLADAEGTLFKKRTADLCVYKGTS